MAGLRVLEVGCGTGIVAIRLAQQGAHIVAVDTSEDMLGVLKDKAARENVLANVTPVQLAVTSGDDLAAYGPFDLALISMALHHIEDPSALLSAMASRLLPGGLIFVVDFADGGPFQDNMVGAEELEKAGVYHTQGFSFTTMPAIFESCGVETVSLATPFAIKREWLMELHSGGSGDDAEGERHGHGHGHGHGEHGHGHGHGEHGHGHGHGEHGHGHGHGHGEHGHGHSHGEHGHGHSHGHGHGHGHAAAVDLNEEYPLIFAVGKKP